MRTACILIALLPYAACPQDSMKSQFSRVGIVDAAEQNDFIKVKALIQKGDSVNTEEGKPTPLMYAVYNKNMEMVQLLVQHGAKINQTNGGETAIYIADYGNYIGQQSPKDVVIEDYLIKQALKGINRVCKASDIRNAVVRALQKLEIWQGNGGIQLHQVFVHNLKKSTIRVMCGATTWNDVAMFDIFTFRGHYLPEPLGKNMATHVALANSGNVQLILAPNTTGKWMVVDAIRDK